MVKYKKEFDERYILKIIPQISQWESIPYAADLACQECNKFDRILNPNCKPSTIVGWCNTDYGYQLVFECPYCFSKFRYHPHDSKFDIDEFVDRIMYIYVGSDRYTNGLELDRKWSEYELSMREHA